MGLKIEREELQKTHWVTENEKQQIEEEACPQRGEGFSFGHIQERGP